VLLNEQTESRTIKLGLLLSESCVDMEIVSTSTEQGKQKQDSFLLLGKSGHVHLYDDTFIERYLLQCQSKSTPSLPKDVTAKLPLADSSITTAKFITNNTNMFYSDDEVIELRNYSFTRCCPFCLQSLFYLNVLIWLISYFSGHLVLQAAGEKSSTFCSG